MCTSDVLYIFSIPAVSAKRFSFSVHKPTSKPKEIYHIEDNSKYLRLQTPCSRIFRLLRAFFLAPSRSSDYFLGVRCYMSIFRSHVHIYRIWMRSIWERMRSSRVLWMRSSRLLWMRSSRVLCMRSSRVLWMRSSRMLWMISSRVLCMRSSRVLWMTLSRVLWMTSAECCGWDLAENCGWYLAECCGWH